jgi:four helix bundle protein
VAKKDSKSSHVIFFHSLEARGVLPNLVFTCGATWIDPVPVPVPLPVPDLSRNFFTNNCMQKYDRSMMIDAATRKKEVVFDHEKLDVYHIAIEFVILSDAIIKHLPRGRAYLCDQLQRAALSIPLNVAEGAGEYAVDEKVRFYRIAKRSATECAGILEVCQKLQLIDGQRYSKGRELLIRLVSLLIKMAQRNS